MYTIRPATIADLQGLQQANLSNLPENYTMKYILYHGISWPQGSYVAVVPTAHGEKIIGYVLAKMEDDQDRAADARPAAHITSITVMRPWRRLGIAGALMAQCLRSIRECQKAESMFLHVRQSNTAALRLYTDTFKFELQEVSAGYYANGENADTMKMDLTSLPVDSDSDTDNEDDELTQLVNEMVSVRV